jgi:uncharacterized protein (TIRG00374 family)
MNTEPESLNDSERPPHIWSWHTVLSGMITLSILALLAAYLDWESIWREILNCKIGYVLLGAACHYATYPVRGLRWRHSLAHLPISGSRMKFTGVVFFYNFVDNVVPAKLGDIYAGHMARINFGIRRSEAIGSIVFLRMLDAWIVLSLALLSSWALLSDHLPNSVLWALAGGGVIALASTMVMIVSLVLDKSLPGWIPEKVREMIRSFRKGMWPRHDQLLPIIGLTVLIWILETLWIYFLAYGFSLAFRPSDAVFLTMVPLLASGFPLTPSGAGVVELTLFSCLRLVGVTAPLAGSITMLNRFIDYWLHIMLGILMWLLRRRLGLRTWREASRLRDALT